MKITGRALRISVVFSTSTLSTYEMGLRDAMLNLLIVVSLVTLTIAIPTSLVEEIKSSEFRNNKVKRQHPSEQISEENDDDVSYYNKPSAIKRGGNDLKSSSSDWDQDQSISSDRNNVPNIPASLYNSPENMYDDKTIADYEKGFRYGSDKDRLDEAVENAVLKSELYGEPSAINQYRYYGADDRKRRRRTVKRFVKRQVDLTPDEILTLLSLYENSLQRPSDSRSRFSQNVDLDLDDDSQEQDDDENWLDSPVYPHASQYDNQDDNQIYEKKKKWAQLSDDRKKRFMVARKRTADPTRELRYLNGPNKNDFYTLSQLLSNQREPNLPVYRRFVL